MEASQSRVLQVIGTLLAMAVLGAVGWLAWILLRALAEAIPNTPPAVAAPVAVAFVGVVGSILTVAVTKRAERRRATDEARRDKKIALYEEFVRFWFGVLMGSRLGKPQLGEAEVMTWMSEWTQKLVMWGSDEFLATWSRFRGLSTSGKSPAEIALAFESVIRAARADVGHANAKVGPGTILGLFINDADKFLRGAQ